MEGMLEIPDSAKSETQVGTIVAISPSYICQGVSVDADIHSGTRVAFKKYHDNDLEWEGRKYKAVHIDSIFTAL